MDRFSDQVNNSSTSKPDRDKECQKLSKPKKDLRMPLNVFMCYLMEVVVLRMLRYWRMSGTDMSLMARKNLKPIQVLSR